MDSTWRLKQVLNGGDMAFILDSIFRRYTRDRAPAVSFSFVWDVKVQYEKGGQQFSFDWEDLDDDLHSAFLIMIRESYLTTLGVFCLDNVPRDLVHGCRIPDLIFTDVTFTPSSALDQSAEGILDSWHLEHIRPFTTSNSTSPLDYIGTVAYNISPPTPSFQNLKTLVCCICDYKEYEMTVALVQRATTIDFLALSLPGTVAFRPWAQPTKLPKHLSYDRLLNLDTLYLTYYNPLRPLAPDYPELVHNVVDVFMPTIPSVRQLRLVFSVFSMNEYSTDVGSIFTGYDFSSIDDFLANSVPPVLENLQICLDAVVSAQDSQLFYIGQFREEGSEYARRFFPRLSKLPVFCITTKAIKCRYIDEEHYSSHPGYKWKYLWGIMEIDS